MQIIEYTEFQYDEIKNLYAAVGWTAYTDDMEALRKGYAHSLKILAATEEDRLLGIIRAVGDGSTIVWIQDLLVFPQEQGKGVGTALVNAMMDYYPAVRQMMLATDNTPNTIAFYRSIGFRMFSEIGCSGFVR